MCYIKDRRPPILAIGPSIAYVPLGKDIFALIDSEDIGRVSKYVWHLRRGSGNYSYATSNSLKEESAIRYMIYMHRIVMGLEKGDRRLVDHRIPERTLDNRRINLRIANASRNAHNAPLRKTNTSGLKGVSKKGNRWRAAIRGDGKTVHLGMFETAAAAHDAYCIAALRYHGEFANFAALTTQPAPLTEEAK